MTKETITSLPIVKKIMNLLKMDDDGQINKFFEKEVKRFEKDIKVLESNKNMISMEKDNAIQEAKDHIEDAKEDFEIAKLAVTVEKVKNNASIDEFRTEYWTNVLYKRDLLKELEKQLTKTEEDYKKQIESIDQAIAERQEMIDMITK